MKNLVINYVIDLKKLLTNKKKNIKQIRNLSFFSKYKSKFFD